MQAFYAGGQFSEPSVILDHIVGRGQALGARCLRCNDAFDFAPGKPIAAHDAGHLGCLGTIHHGDPLHAFVVVAEMCIRDRDSDD